MNVAALVILIVPPSLCRRPSASATAVVPLEVPPSIKFNSVVVTVAPSKISNCASVTVAEPNTKFPEIVVVPETAKFPTTSISVAVNSISSVAAISNTVALAPCIN